MSCKVTHLLELAHTRQPGGTNGTLVSSQIKILGFTEAKQDKKQKQNQIFILEPLIIVRRVKGISTQEQWSNLQKWGYRFNNPNISFQNFRKF